VNLCSIQLNTELKNILSHLNDLKVASHKVSDAQNIINEKEWKRVHSSSHNTYSVMLYICLVLIGVYTLYTPI
jgi:glycopeptide antibiotics resistance protein